MWLTPVVAVVAAAVVLGKLRNFCLARLNFDVNTNTCFCLQQNWTKLTKHHLSVREKQKKSMCLVTFVTNHYRGKQVYQVDIAIPWRVEDISNL